MNISNLLCYAFGVSAAAVAILAGCSNGGSPSSFAPSGATQQSVTQAGADAQTRGSVTQYYLVDLGIRRKLLCRPRITNRGWISGASSLPGSKGSTRRSGEPGS